MQNQKKEVGQEVKSADIEFLEYRIRLYISLEEYERAAVLKKWLDEIISWKEGS